MPRALVVTAPFGDYAAGDRITDTDLIETHRHRADVVAIDVPEARAVAERGAEPNHEHGEG